MADFNLEYDKNLKFVCVATPERRDLGAGLVVKTEREVKSSAPGMKTVQRGWHGAKNKPSGGSNGHVWGEEKLIGLDFKEGKLNDQPNVSVSNILSSDTTKPPV